MFDKILIANRGEITCRIIRTCRRLGISTVAVYSEADADAQHVKMADEAICVGPAPSAESYLRVDRIIEVAQQTGASAIHPGYGFLSENQDFARACNEAGIVFIGPPVSAISAMGSKSAAKSLMEKAGVPLVPGYHGDEQSPEFLRERAGEIGYPVLIKASAGGGGKGMRVVESDAEFLESLASCQREARAGFGDDHVLIEKFLDRPRHIEIQIFGDQQGQLVHLHERDCSAQRRHQKVVEEAPAPGMSAEQRAAMGAAACDAARAVGYVGAGTVEFIADQAGNFYFMEMNTRLQVEHPVTEMISGQDLVEWQLRVADGEPLPLTQENISLKGHSIEVRVYAEEPEKGFLPSIGTLRHLRLPPCTPNLRIDSGFAEGDHISPHYDPMLAKVIVWDQTREQARRRLLQALAEIQVVGVGNNIEFLARLIAGDAFREGVMDTGLIGRQLEALTRPASTVPREVFLAAALRFASQDQAPDPIWNSNDGWRLNGDLVRPFELSCGESGAILDLHYCDGLRLLDQQACALDSGALSWGDRKLAIDTVVEDETVHVFYQGRRFPVAWRDPLRHAGENLEDDGELRAPMPGKIIAMVAAVGDTVTKGAPLLVMEAMKMEHTLSAPADGKVLSFNCAEGDQVEEGAELIEFDAGKS